MGKIPKAWITSPSPITGDLPRHIPLKPRFGLREQHGNGLLKLNITDDYQVSEINKTTGVLETGVPGSPNVSLSMERTHS